MPNYSYDIKNCESILKSEVVKLSIIALILLLLFAGIIIYSIVQIKSDRMKKSPYIQLIGAVVLIVFLAIALGSHILSNETDIAEE